MSKIVINPLDLRGCYSSGIIEQLSIFNELCLEDREGTFYEKGNRSFILIALFIFILVIGIIFDSRYSVNRMMR